MIFRCCLLGCQAQSVKAIYCNCYFYWVSSNEVVRQPIFFVWIPIIIILQWESMAAHRMPWWKVVKFGTLFQDSLISQWSKFEVASPTALAPATGQSSTCINVYNFRPIHRIFTDKISLDSLGQAEFNAPYPVILRHDGFSAILFYVKNLQNATPITDFVQSSRILAHMIFRP